MNSDNSSSAQRWNLWPISIIAFFVVAIFGCGTFLAFCSRHPADLISPNYYEDEVRYQGHIDRLKRTQERASLASASYDVATKTIKISLPESPAQCSGQIQLYRPSAANLDRQLELKTDSRGIQNIDGSSLVPGLWKVRVSWKCDERDYFIDQQVVIPSRT